MWIQKRLVLVLSVLLISACETIQQQIKTPEVDLLAVQIAERQGLRQMFDVKLSLSNPNAFDLNLTGVNYELVLEGFNVINGSANQIPTIPAYGDQSVDVKVGLGIVEGLQLVNKLTQKREPSLDYALRMQLDTGLPVFGVIPVSRSGTLNSESFSR